ncbi:hypothetical protein K435DRAFT_795381 [Dendrothele bispora CBS 962.96]|uniref:Uncharacterized protein n=1 Tax=Dendrothele bispora (strain CBS 962.96) TaxID=1314807 RepID=A0A4S8M9G7_DENBC|nr:hypothetical protein K435DRAFT_795381 [Dendrothele bispora CBS 962.96]
MLPPTDRFVIIGDPDKIPVPGIYSLMQWKKGGFNVPLFPLAIQCGTPQQAQMFYTQLQPWLDQWMPSLRSKMHDLHRGFFRQEVFDQVCAALNDVHKGSFFWAVIYGSRAGVYMSAEEAIKSVDYSGKAAFRRCKMLLVLVPHMGNQSLDLFIGMTPMTKMLQPCEVATAPPPVVATPPPVASPVPSARSPTPATPTRSHTYASQPVTPGHQPCPVTPQSPATSATRGPATPQTPTAPQTPVGTPRVVRSPAREDWALNVSPSFNINFTGSTTTSTQELDDWVRYYLTSHNFAENDIEVIHQENMVEEWDPYIFLSEIHGYQWDPWVSSVGSYIPQWIPQWILLEPAADAGGLPQTPMDSHRFPQRATDSHGEPWIAMDSFICMTWCWWQHTLSTCLFVMTQC